MTHDSANSIIGSVLAGALLALCVAWPAAGAETPAAGPPAVDEAAAKRQETMRQDLARIQGEIKLSDETLARLRKEIQAIGADSEKLRQQLVDTGNQTHETEAKVLGAEARLASLDSNEDNIHVSLDSKRGLLIEVLASLQRMGRNPPPALLVSPDDALEAVRTAMLLGAVLPEMRQEMQALAADLKELARVRGEITVERDTLKQALITLAEQRTRTQLLVEERQKVLAQEQNTLASEQAHATALAQEAANLKDLIARMEREVAPAKRAADAANGQARPSLAALQDPSRLTPAMPFDQAKGLLRLPVTGTMLRGFGADDGNGGATKGMTLAAAPGASVTAPCDGWVVFAGKFRSYGQLLIINAGGGYHVVMAGMDKINVGLGQFVLTGEPVAAMGSGPSLGSDAGPGSQAGLGKTDSGKTDSGMQATAAAFGGASSAGQAALYIEFRKDGVSIDPTPWWANQGEKARG
ncbi:peptidoglycan DD-metalloendopeptidase family protein [Labrys sp. LIt4]|uniref:murein hydrolase activator EnvC family protein n=1 Tax=Labrys sp. LIt4 TaxID=2821355 RepID=UPI001ADFF4AF|nr:peptidoglycan DD-metalloendopeptidase family protein [Labrys sp. LIt4]MBP0579626.1 peptidoglycan DD-metalloendopeptidase family protein [Labrys sp. LIt4]